MLSFSRPESSMPDLLKDIREQLDARLAELRPLVDEHGRLNAAMKAERNQAPSCGRDASEFAGQDDERSRSQAAAGQAAQARTSRRQPPGRTTSRF